jgi:signal transduction histidine kinase
MERFDMSELIQSVVDSAGIMAGQKKVKLSFINPGPVYVWADEYMMDEVVTNYLTNAFNHVKGDNVIEIKEIVQDNGVLRVSVFNSGDPIPEEEMSKIWDKFYKVDKARTREYGGNGIGLSIVKAIMEAHNQSFGAINYDNGVEFYFELDIKMS